MKKKTILIAIPFIGMAILFVIYLVFYFSQETRSLTSEVKQKAPGKFITLPNGDVHYQLLGSDSSELLIFIHGGGITGQEVWNKNIPFFLQNGFQILSYDLYDRGYSARVSVENSPQLFLTQLSLLMDSLNLKERPYHIICMSMGAIIALDYASEFSQQAQKIAMIDPAASGDFKANKVLSYPVISDFLMTVYWYPRAKENQRKEFVNKNIFEPYSQRLEYFMNIKGYKKTNYSTWFNMLNQNKLPLLQKLDGKKVLLLYGDQDPYFPKNNIKLYQSHNPSIQIKEINDAGHMPHMEKPDEVNAAILHFLKEN